MVILKRVKKGMNLNKALLIVDVQRDFCPGGALAVKEGDKIVPILNKYIKIFSKRNLPIFASRDWHPKKTSHFKKFGGLWPVHCVQNTRGARFHPKLKLPKNVIILSKGMDPGKDSYSVFQAYVTEFPARGGARPEREKCAKFLKVLKILNIKELYVGGLATDFCVKWSVLDALKHGFKVKLLVDAIRGVNIKPDDSKIALKKMIRSGAKKMTVGRLGPRLKGTHLSTKNVKKCTK